MKVLLKKVGQPFEFAEIKNELPEMQELVEGFIEVVKLAAPGFVVICDEEALYRADRRVNCMVPTNYKRWTAISGTFFVCMTEAASFAGIPEDEKDPKELAKSLGLIVVPTIAQKAELNI